MRNEEAKRKMNAARCGGNRKWQLGKKHEEMQQGWTDEKMRRQDDKDGKQMESKRMKGL